VKTLCKKNQIITTSIHTYILQFVLEKPLLMRKSSSFWPVQCIFEGFCIANLVIYINAVHLYLQIEPNTRNSEVEKLGPFTYSLRGCWVFWANCKLWNGSERQVTYKIYICINIIEKNGVNPLRIDPYIQKIFTFYLRTLRRNM
jgi:hypothetical protein